MDRVRYCNFRADWLHCGGLPDGIYRPVEYHQAGNYTLCAGMDSDCNGSECNYDYFGQSVDGIRMW